MGGNYDPHSVVLSKIGQSQDTKGNYGYPPKLLRSESNSYTVPYPFCSTEQAPENYFTESK